MLINRFLILLLLLFLSCTGGRTIEIVVTNTTGVALQGAAVTVDFKPLQKAYAGLRLNDDLQLADENGTLQQTQFDDINGDQKWDEIIFLADFSPGETRRFRFKQRVPVDDTLRTLTHLWLRLDDQLARPLIVDDVQVDRFPHNQRYAGITWGDGKRIFRMQFDGRNAIDLLPKALVKGLQEMSQDSLKKSVGITWPLETVPEISPGLGGFSLLENDSLSYPLSLFGFSAHVLKRGPVRTVIRLDFDDWAAGSRFYKLTWLIMAYHHKGLTEHRLYLKPMQVEGSVPIVALEMPLTVVSGDGDLDHIFLSEAKGLQVGWVMPEDGVAGILKSGGRTYRLGRFDLQRVPPLRYYLAYVSGSDIIASDALSALCRDVSRQMAHPLQVKF